MEYTPTIYFFNFLMFLDGKKVLAVKKHGDKKLIFYLENKEIKLEFPSKEIAKTIFKHSKLKRKRACYY